MAPSSLASTRPVSATATSTNTLTADSTAEFGCFNKGGNHPQAANKETIEHPVVAEDSFQAKNGRIRGTITTDPPSAGDFSCPGGQRLSLISVSYTNIVLTDTTNNKSIEAADVSRTFVNV